MKHLSILILTITLFGVIPPPTALAQPEMVWSQHYGDEFGEFPTSITESGDGGYVIAGIKTQSQGGDQDVFIMKVDENGDSLWCSIYGGEGDQRANDIIQTSDGGYLVVGSNEFNREEKALILKFDSEGGFVSQQLVCGDLYEMYRYHKILAAPDGSFLLLGVAIRIIEGHFYMNTDCLITKFSAEGEVVWSQLLGESDVEEYCYDGIITSDGGLALTGYWWDFNNEAYSEALLMKVSPGIEIEWTRRYGLEDGIEIIYSVVQDANGGYAMAGIESLDFPLEYVLKTDVDGEPSWSRTFGSAEDLSYAQWIGNYDDNGFLMAGYTTAEGSGNYDFHLVSLDAEGNQNWSRAWGGEEADRCLDVLPTDDGGYLLVGETNNFGNINPFIPDIWLIKVFDPSAVAPESAVPIPTALSLSPAYPNPFNSTTVVSFQTPFTGAIKARLVDESGREWRKWTTEPMRSGTGRFVVDGAGLSTGAYWLNVRQGRESVQQRIVLVK